MMKTNLYTSLTVSTALTRSLRDDRIGDAGACGIGKGLASNTALQTLMYVACRCHLQN